MKTKAEVLFSDYEQAEEWWLLLELHGLRPYLFGRAVSWAIDLTASAPIQPDDAVSRLRMEFKADVAVLGFADESQEGFTSFGSIDARAFSDTHPEIRRRTLVTLTRLISFVQGVAAHILEGKTPSSPSPRKDMN